MSLVRVPLTVNEMETGDRIVHKQWRDSQAELFVGKHPTDPSLFVTLSFRGDEDGLYDENFVCEEWFKLIEET